MRGSGHGYRTVIINGLMQSCSGRAAGVNTGARVTHRWWCIWRCRSSCKVRLSSWSCGEKTKKCVWFKPRTWAQTRGSTLGLSPVTVILGARSEPPNTPSETQTAQRRKQPAELAEANAEPSVSFKHRDSPAERKLSSSSHVWNADGSTTGTPRGVPQAPLELHSWS